jgi:hypothetical protein
MFLRWSISILHLTSMGNLLIFGVRGRAREEQTVCRRFGYETNAGGNRGSIDF